MLTAAINDFRLSGICLLKKNIFAQVDFLPAATTDTAVTQKSRKASCEETNTSAFSQGT